MPNRLISVLVCALFAIGGCSGDDSGQDDASTASSAPTVTDATTTTTTSTTTTTETSVCSANGRDPAELAALLADDVPAEYARHADDFGYTGPSDLDKAARDDSGADAAAVLTELKFARGYQRLWQTEGSDQLILFVYEFCDETGAAGYLSRTRDSFTASDSTLEPFTPTSIPAEIGYRRDEDGVGVVTLPTQTGRYLVQVVSVGDTTSASWDIYYDRAVALLLAQIDRLQQ